MRLETAVGFQEVVAASSERQGALAAVQREPHQPFVSQMTEVGLAGMSRLLARIAQVAFGHHPKGSDGCERPAVVAAEFVPVIAIHRDLSFESAGQFGAFEEYISWIVVSFASVPIAVTNVAAVARIVWVAIKSRFMTQLCPRHLDVADVIIAVAGIEVEHGMLTSMADTIASTETTRVIMRSREIGGNSRSESVGRCEVERVLSRAAITQRSMTQAAEGECQVKTRDGNHGLRRPSPKRRMCVPRATRTAS